MSSKLTTQHGQVQLMQELVNDFTYVSTATIIRANMMAETKYLTLHRRVHSV